MTMVLIVQLVQVTFFMGMAKNSVHFDGACGGGVETVLADYALFCLSPAMT